MFMKPRMSLPCLCALAIVIADSVASSAPATLEIKVAKNVAVPMRDGTILRADVYRPTTRGPFPVLVSRSPYGKPGGMSHAKAGYIVVCQVTRGRYESDGIYRSFVHAQDDHAEDGYDTIEWAAKLPGSNGKVGTFGASYNAYTQWKMAPLRPPSLVVMSAHSIPARMTELEGPGTIRPGRRWNWWYRTMSWDMRKRSGGKKPHSRAEATKLWSAGKDEELLNFLPWLDLPDSMFGHEAKVVKDWLRNPTTDPWQLPEGCSDVAVPNFDVVGWFDHCNGSIGLHRKMVAEGYTEVARTRQRLVIGPWSHTGRGGRKVGQIDFGPKASFNVRREETRWFDHWLKGEQNGIDKEPPVRIFVMGANEWRSENEWPLKRAKNRTWFLASQGEANTPAGNGSLSRKPTGRKSTDQYKYDPKDPVPTLWSKAQFTVPADQAPLAKREDILVYQTAPLNRTIEVTGYPEVTIHASSSAPDTDFFARLIDVAPDGVARDISMGVVRARYRNGLEREELLTPNEVTEFVIKLRPTSNLFQVGHRIRLDITSSDFPNYDRHHNTAANQNADARLVVAKQTLHHGPQFRSRVTLPVILD
jgi:putative CocE/NonD family hydrolase